LPSCFLKVVDMADVQEVKATVGPYDGFAFIAIAAAMLQKLVPIHDLGAGNRNGRERCVGCSAHNDRLSREKSFAKGCPGNALHGTFQNSLTQLPIRKLAVWISEMRYDSRGRSYSRLAAGPS